MNIKIYLLLLLSLIQVNVMSAQNTISMWVGETWTMEPSSVNGSPYNVEWSTSHPDCLTLDPTGYLYCKVTPVKYFADTATVTLKYNYKNSVGIERSYSLSRYVLCNDNPVNVDPQAATLQIGGTLKLNHSHQNKEYESAAQITYSSSATSIATVSSTGRITAKKPGTARIYVHSTLANDENAAYCEVTVSEPTIVLPKTLTINLTETKTITATTTPATGLTITWASSNTAVATVSSTGKVTAKKKGTARITATISGYPSSTDYCDVTVTADPKGISFPVENVSLAIGQSITIMPTVTPAGAEYTLTWSSDNSTVAKVTNGTVLARSVGTAKITTKATSIDGTRKLYASYYVTVVNTLRGDVNNDTRVNIEDVTALISYLLKGSGAININNSDIDGDGKVNIVDITALINLLLEN